MYCNVILQRPEKLFYNQLIMNFDSSHKLKKVEETVDKLSDTFVPVLRLAVM